MCRNSSKMTIVVSLHQVFCLQLEMSTFYKSLSCNCLEKNVKQTPPQKKQKKNPEKIQENKNKTFVMCTMLA